MPPQRKSGFTVQEVYDAYPLAEFVCLPPRKRDTFTSYLKRTKIDGDTLLLFILRELANARDKTEALGMLVQAIDDLESVDQVLRQQALDEVIPGGIKVKKQSERKMRPARPVSSHGSG